MLSLPVCLSNYLFTHLSAYHLSPSPSIRTQSVSVHLLSIHPSTDPAPGISLLPVYLYVYLCVYLASVPVCSTSAFLFINPKPPLRVPLPEKFCKEKAILPQREQSYKISRMSLEQEDKYHTLSLIWKLKASNSQRPRVEPQRPELAQG